MEIVLETKGEEEVRDSDSTDPKELEEFNNDRHQKRMYSFKQLFNIFTSVNNKSEVHDRLVAAEDNIETIYDTLGKHDQTHKDLREYID